MSPICVAVRSASPIIRLGIQALLGASPGRVAVADPGRAWAPQDVDVVVYDAARLDGPDREQLRRLVRETPAVVAVVPACRPDLAQRVRQLGVAACVSLDVTAADLVAVVEAASIARSRGGAASRPRPRSAARDSVSV